MSDVGLDDLRSELSRLEAEEVKLSEIRRRLHRRVDSLRTRLGELQSV